MRPKEGEGLCPAAIGKVRPYRSEGVIAPKEGDRQIGGCVHGRGVYPTTGMTGIATGGPHTAHPLGIGLARYERRGGAAPHACHRTVSDQAKVKGHIGRGAGVLVLEAERAPTTPERDIMAKIAAMRAH